MSMRLKSSAGTKTVPEMTDLQAQPLSNVSLDSVKTEGEYFFSTASGVTGCAVATSGSLKVLRVGVNSYTQLVCNGTHFFLRTYWENSWGAWRKIESSTY